MACSCSISKRTSTSVNDPLRVKGHTPKHATDKISLNLTEYKTILVSWTMEVTQYGHISLKLFD